MSRARASVFFIVFWVVSAATLAFAQETGGSFGGGSFSSGGGGDSSSGGFSGSGGGHLDGSSAIDLAVLAFRFLPPKYSVPIAVVIGIVWLVSALRSKRSDGGPRS